MIIEIPVSVAELFDKISILEIKLEQVADPAKVQFVRQELELLSAITKEHKVNDFLGHVLYQELRLTNRRLWDVCEERRRCELEQRFDAIFVEKSRLEYQTNDQRALIKQRINHFFNSSIQEVKSYGGLLGEAGLTAGVKTK
jgi:hypothetical protein